MYFVVEDIWERDWGDGNRPPGVGLTSSQAASRRQNGGLLSVRQGHVLKAPQTCQPVTSDPLGHYRWLTEPSPVKGFDPARPGFWTASRSTWRMCPPTVRMPSRPPARPGLGSGVFGGNLALGTKRGRVTRTADRFCMCVLYVVSNWTLAVCKIVAFWGGPFRAVVCCYFWRSRQGLP